MVSYMSKNFGPVSLITNEIIDYVIRSQVKIVNFVCAKRWYVSY